MDWFDWSWVVNWSWLISWLVNWGWWVSSMSFIRYISNISRVGIINMVVDDLGATVGEGNTVLARNNTVVILQSDKNQSMDLAIGTQTYFGIDFRLGFVK